MATVARIELYIEMIEAAIDRRLLSDPWLLAYRIEECYELGPALIRARFPSPS